MLKQPLLSPLFSPSREPHFVTQCFMNEETEAKEGFCNHPGSKCESFDTHPKTGLHYIATKSRCLKFSVLCAFPISEKVLIHKEGRGGQSDFSTHIGS